MTFEELKKEAKKQGYKLIKIKPSVKFLPCICGCKRRTWWSSSYMMSDRKSETFVVCKRCGLQSPKVVGNNNDVKIAWNNMILELSKNKQS